MQCGPLVNWKAIYSSGETINLGSAFMGDLDIYSLSGWFTNVCTEHRTTGTNLVGTTESITVYYYYYYCLL